jgi:hypothetical protein
VRDVGHRDIDVVNLHARAKAVVAIHRNYDGRDGSACGTIGGMRSLVIVVIACRLAAAQPGNVPPAYAYQPALSSDDRGLLASGEIPNVGAAIAADALVGFGIGQAIEHRWSETGWIFTFGETIATAVFFDGLVRTVDCGFPPSQHERQCSNDNNLALGGAIALTVLRVWGFLDTTVGPVHHNARLRALRARLEPSAGGLALRF